MLSSSLSLLLFLLLSSLSLSLSSSPSPSPSSPSPKAPISCLYVTRQADHQVIVYRDLPNPKHPAELKLESGTDITAFPTRPLPTGVTVHVDRVYVASYGNMAVRRRKDEAVLKPAIQVFSISKGFKGKIFAEDEHLSRCFPEDITNDGIHLYVACGVPGVGVLKYELSTKKYKGKMAEGENISAVWGVEVYKDHLYFSSHCTGVDTKCSPQTQDKIFKVPLSGGPSDVTVFASKPKDLEVGGFGDLSFGPEGNLYVTSQFHQDVLVFNAFGGFDRKMNLMKVENPVSIIFHNDQGYITEPVQGIILEIDPNTDRRQPFGIPGPLLNSKLMYLGWGKCPPPFEDEAPALSAAPAPTPTPVATDRAEL